MNLLPSRRRAVVLRAIPLFLGLGGPMSWSAMATDPLFSQQWYFHNTGQVVNGQAGTPGVDIKVLDAWSVHQGSRTILVAVVGSGVNAHPEFADRLWPGRSMIGDPQDFSDHCGTGTMVAGLVAASADNGMGIAGLAGPVNLLPVRVQEGCTGPLRALAHGLRWAVDQGAAVIVVPVSSYNSTFELESAVAYAAAADVVIVATGGHDDNGEITYPAVLPDCLAVAATDGVDARSLTSNTGPELDLSAPGVNIMTTTKEGGYSVIEDAWWAAPALVAGSAALLRSYAPSRSAAEVRMTLRDSAKDLGAMGTDPQFGHGRLDVAEALFRLPPPALHLEPISLPPASVLPGVNATVRVRIDELAESLVPGSSKVWWRADSGPFAPMPMSTVGNNEFEAMLPAGSCDSVIEFYLSAEGTGGTTIRFPHDAPGSVRRVRAIEYEVLFEDEFESDLGWTSSAGPAAVSGTWERVDPLGTRDTATGHEVQPEYDFTPSPGAACYVTAQHNGSATQPWLHDLDGGPFVLTSPVIPLPAEDVEIEFARWFYWNGVGVEDHLVVEISRDGGTSWIMIEDVEADGVWQQRRFRLSDYPQLLGSQFRIRFTTGDDDNDSITEAAVDDVRVLGMRCLRADGDADRDGFLGLPDYQFLFDCLDAIPGGGLGGGCLVFDFDGSSRVDLRDVATFSVRFGMMINP